MIDFSKQKLLVIAPHPDDEVLGCGGLIKRIKDSGGSVYVMFISLGDTKDFTKKGLSTTKERQKEIEKVAKFLKYDDYLIAFKGSKYHLRMDQMAQLDLIATIESKTKLSINKIKPTIIATPQIFDYNQDHRAASAATIAATRPVPDGLKSLTKIVLNYEFSATALWGIESPKIPNFFVELSDDDLNAKLKAMELYSSQVRSGASARSVETIKSFASIRGSQVGVSGAEAFYSMRVLV